MKAPRTFTKLSSLLCGFARFLTSLSILAGPKEDGQAVSSRTYHPAIRGPRTEVRAGIP